MDQGLIEKLLENNRLKSVEIRMNNYADGDTIKTEYVAIGRADRYMVRATAFSLTKALESLDAKAD